jgi:hypothetical protein
VEVDRGEVYLVLELLSDVTTRGVVVLFVAGLVYVLVVEEVPGLV